MLQADAINASIVMIMMSLLFRMKLVVVMAMIIVHDEGDSSTHLINPYKVMIVLIFMFCSNCRYGECFADFIYIYAIF